MPRSRHDIARDTVQRYGHARQWTQRIPGGTTRPPAEFDGQALFAGVIVELEHADDPCVALEIAMDHLAEDPTYYDKLATIHHEQERNPSSGGRQARIASRIRNW